MKYLILSLAATIICVSCIVAQQEPDVPANWTKINVCHFSFFAPPDMKDLATRGVDSCVARFANQDITVYLDYGQYGGPHRQGNSDLEFKEQSLSIDGKKAQLVTYIDASHSNSGLYYNASLYVIVKESELDGRPKPISLMMSIRGERQKDRETALTIFRTIRFQ